MIVQGVYLPEGEVHFRETLETIARKRTNACYPVLQAALPLAYRRRRTIDVGAHVGLWARWVVNLFHRLDAFEPVKEYADLLRKNVPFDRCVIHNVALGEKPGFVGMKLFPGNTGQAHIVDGADVEMLPLDSFGFNDVDLLKIDVQGYETSVLKGATETLKRCRPVVVIESCGLGVQDFGEPEDEMALSYLESLGAKRVEHIGHDWIMKFP